MFNVEELLLELVDYKMLQSHEKYGSYYGIFDNNIIFALSSITIERENIDLNLFNLYIPSNKLDNKLLDYMRTTNKKYAQIRYDYVTGLGLEFINCTFPLVLKIPIK